MSKDPPADRAAAAPAPEACGCGWEGGLRRYCDQHNPCFPTSLRNGARAAAPAPDAQPIESPNEPHCGNCGGTQFEIVPVVDGGEEERCLTCGESERVSSPADRPTAAPAPEGLDLSQFRLDDRCDAVALAMERTITHRFDHTVAETLRLAAKALRARPALSDETLRRLLEKWDAEAAARPYSYNAQHDPEQNYARGKEDAATELRAVLARQQEEK